MKNTFLRIMRESGFYIVLFLCVSALGFAGVKMAKDKREEKKIVEEELLIMAEEESVRETTQMEEVEEEENLHDFQEDNLEEENEEETKEEEKRDNDLEFVEENQDPTPVAEVGASSENMILPVEGRLGVDFSKDDLIYSETLEEWTSHEGVDIFTQEGAEVKAVSPGQVREVYEDELWGMVIIVDHGNGLMSKYANLSTLDMVKEGSQVEKGAVISKVGNTAAIEMIMEPHIHFELIKEGINIDPKEFIPGLSN